MKRRTIAYTRRCYGMTNRSVRSTWRRANSQIDRELSQPPGNPAEKRALDTELLATSGSIPRRVNQRPIIRERSGEVARPRIADAFPLGQDAEAGFDAVDRQEFD